MVDKREFYINNTNNTARFVLGESGDKPLICFGVNCSTAEPGNLDPTVRRVRNIAEQEGFDGWVMLNLYAKRETKFDLLEDKGDEALHQKNLKHIGIVLNEYPNAMIWAAWGGLVQKRIFLKRYLKDIISLAGKNIRWAHRGALVGKSGHPHHPLYLKKDAKFKDFDIANYLSRAW